MYSHFLSLNTASGTPARFTAKASGKGMYFRCVLLRFSSDKRNASCLRTQHDNSRAPSLLDHYTDSSLLWTPPTPNVSAHRVMVSPTASGLQTPTRWASQVPRPLFPRALSAITPTGRSAACAVCFADRAGFAIFGRLATRIFVFRGRNRFNLSAYGSRFRCPASYPRLRLLSADQSRFPCFVTSA